MVLAGVQCSIRLIILDVEFCGRVSVTDHGRVCAGVRPAGDGHEGQGGHRQDQQHKHISA